MLLRLLPCACVAVTVSFSCGRPSPPRADPAPTRAPPRSPPEDVPEDRHKRSIDDGDDLDDELGPGPAPSVEHHLRLERVRSYNRHRTGSAGGLSGADHENLSGTIALDLERDGSVHLYDHGSHRESHLDGDSHSETTRTWSSRWTGRWKPSNETMKIALTRAEYTCENEKKLRIGLTSQATQLDCPPSQKRALLRCTPITVELAPNLGQEGAEEETVEAWSCSAQAELGGSPAPWIFGRDRCIRLADGPGSRVGNHHTLCTAEP